MLHTRQHSLRRAIACQGKGLHSGQDVHMRLVPAEAGHGIVFVRTDLSGDNVIPARYDYVSDTRLCSMVANGAGASVGTVEHLMAALAGMGVDNLRIEVDGPEVPVMDGSSAPFVFLIECAGLYEQEAPRHYLQILQPMQIHHDDSWIEVEPVIGASAGLVMDVTIDFANPMIGHQNIEVDFARSSFKSLISRARTFGFAHEVDHLRSIGLAQGGSLDNAIVVGNDSILNPEGLRYQDEFVRHKMLDCLGDLYLAGMPLLGRVRGYRVGHHINNMLLHALLESDNMTEIVTLDEARESYVPAIATSMPLEARL